MRSTRSTDDTSTTAGTTHSRRGLKIAPGETVQFETRRRVVGAAARDRRPRPISAKLDLARVNPVTGPVYIDGAKPGDALKVTVLSFRPSGWGWTGNIPGFGLLTDQFPNARLHHWNYDPGLDARDVRARRARAAASRSPARSASRLRAPGLHSIIPPRNVGGNMDVRDIAEGTELYLPIEVDGRALLGGRHARRARRRRGLRHRDRKPRSTSR